MQHKLTFECAEISTNTSVTPASWMRIISCDSACLGFVIFSQDLFLKIYFSSVLQTGNLNTYVPVCLTNMLHPFEHKIPLIFSFWTEMQKRNENQPALVVCTNKTESELTHIIKGHPILSEIGNKIRNMYIVQWTNWYRVLVFISS